MRERTGEDAEEREGGRNGGGLAKKSPPRPHTLLLLFRQSDALDRDTFPAGPKPAAVVAQLIRDKRLLDSNPRLNLATFVATSVEKECEELMLEALNVNAIDEEEYPSATEIHAQCVRQLADLTNAEGVCGKLQNGKKKKLSGARLF